MSKPQLFMLHFAGGNRYSYQFLKPYLVDFDFVPLELPGRGKRIRENLLTNFEEAIEDLYHQLRQHLGTGRFLIYGHSMGSVMALKIAARLEQQQLFPLQIIVSGNPGPGINDAKKRYLLNREQLKEELKEIGGVPDEILLSDELFEFFEPILKADFEVSEKTNDSLFTPVKAPIYAMMGTEEEKTEAIDNWKKYTVSEFESRIFDGNHFFIYRHAEQIAAIIRDCFQRKLYGMHTS